MHMRSKARYDMNIGWSSLKNKLFKAWAYETKFIGPLISDFVADLTYVISDFENHAPIH